MQQKGTILLHGRKHLLQSAEHSSTIISCTVSKLARVVVEKVEGICCCVDPARSRVGTQQKERDVAGFNLQKSPRSASVLSSASQEVFVLK